MRRKNLKRFGSIGVEEGLLDAPSLEAALERQAKLSRGGEQIKIGALLVEAGALEPADLERILELQRRKYQQRTIGPYEIRKVLGEGGMGKVYTARRVADGAEFALKVLGSSSASDPEMVARFRREARVLLELDHPNLVGGEELGYADGQHFLVMEYVPGTPLDRLIGQAGKLAEDRALSIVRDIAAGLGYAAGRNLVHRDIKPQNIILRPEGQAVLLDMGLARSRTHGTQVTQTGHILGTPDYMSPEQVEGRELGFASDLYSLGATLYHLLTGRPPFRSGDDYRVVMQAHLTREVPDPTEWVPDLSDGCLHILMRLLAKDPGDRYAHPDALIEDIDLVGGGQAPASPPLDDKKTTLQVQLARRRRRRLQGAGPAGRRPPGGPPVLAIVGGAVGIVLLVVTVGLVLFGGSRPPQPVAAEPVRSREEGPVDEDPTPVADPDPDPDPVVRTDDGWGTIVNAETGLEFQTPAPGWTARGEALGGAASSFVVTNDDRTIRLTIEFARKIGPFEHRLEAYRDLDLAGRRPFELIETRSIPVGPGTGLMFSGRAGPKAIAVAYYQDDLVIYRFCYEGTDPAPDGLFERFAGSLVPIRTFPDEPTLPFEIPNVAMRLSGPDTWKVGGSGSRGIVETAVVGERACTLELATSPFPEGWERLDVEQRKEALISIFRQVQIDTIASRTEAREVYRSELEHGPWQRRGTWVVYDLKGGNPTVPMRIHQLLGHDERAWCLSLVHAPPDRWHRGVRLFEAIARSFERTR